MSKWHKHMASSKKKRGREKEGVESEKRDGEKMWAIFIAICVNILLQKICLKTKKK